MRSSLASEKLRGVPCEISVTESEVEKLLRVLETNGFAIVRRPPSSSESYIFDRSQVSGPASGMKAPSSLF